MLARLYNGAEVCLCLARLYNGAEVCLCLARLYNVSVKCASVSAASVGGIEQQTLM